MPKGQERKNRLKGLEEELAGYEARGDKDRAAEVREEIGRTKSGRTTTTASTRAAKAGKKEKANANPPENTGAE